MNDLPELDNLVKLDLIFVSANSMPRTIGEKQTPIHYAAKYNAVSSLKVLIENRVDYNDRDYKDRTPIFLAAEMGESFGFVFVFGEGVVLPTT